MCHKSGAGVEENTYNNRYHGKRNNIYIKKSVFYHDKRYDGEDDDNAEEQI